jgi:hypothetical protein
MTSYEVRSMRQDEHTYDIDRAHRSGWLVWSCVPRVFQAWCVHVCAQLIAPVVTTEPAERKHERDVLAPFVKHLATLIKMTRSSLYGKPNNEFLEGRLEGMEAALVLFKEGRT